MRDYRQIAAAIIAGSLASVKENGANEPHFSDDQIVTRARSIADKLDASFDADCDDSSDAPRPPPPPPPPYVPPAPFAPPVANAPSDPPQTSSPPEDSAPPPPVDPSAPSAA